MSKDKMKEPSAEQRLIKALGFPIEVLANGIEHSINYELHNTKDGNWGNIEIIVRETVINRKKLKK